MIWKTAGVVLLALLAGFYVLFSIATRTPAPPAHQVFINGDVLTMDGSNRVVEAISVRDDRIEQLGSTEDIMASVSDDTVVVDLRGRTLLPGFIDAHGHFPGSGLAVIAADVSSPPIGSVRNIDDLIAAMRAQVERTPDGYWVQGAGYDDTLLAEKRHPTREDR